MLSKTIDVKGEKVPVLEMFEEDVQQERIETVINSQRFEFNEIDVWDYRETPWVTGFSIVLSSEEQQDIPQEIDSIVIEGKDYDWVLENIGVCESVFDEEQGFLLDVDADNVSRA